MNHLGLILVAAVHVLIKHLIRFELLYINYILKLEGYFIELT